MNETVDPLQKRSRIYGLLIIAIIALPMLTAYIMFKTGWGIPIDTSNKGTLLQPARAIGELALNNQDDILVRLIEDENKRWRILVPITKECDEICQNHLYISRQVHIRLAEKAYRVERILLRLDSLSVDAIDNLKQEHPETIMVDSNIDALNQWLAVSKLPLSAENYFYLVDQDGYAMMYYDVDHKGQDLLDDVKKVLKFTYDK
jgi:cytochrome oxidase Cu insertion factor (SCO1/SenC/PrrC family)